MGLLKQARWDPDRAADLFYSGGMQGQEMYVSVCVVRARMMLSGATKEFAFGDVGRIPGSR